MTTRVPTEMTTGFPFTEPGYVSPEQTIVSGGQLVLAHGLGVKPELIQSSIVCKTAQHNYAVDDETPIASSQVSSASANHFGLSVVADATNITIRVGSGGIIVLDATSGNSSTITNGNWRLKVRAWA